MRAIGALRGNAGLRLEHGGDAHRVPDAVAPPLALAYRHLERGGNRREWTGHAQLETAGLEDENVGLGQLLVRSAHVFGWLPQRIRRLVHLGQAAGFDHLAHHVESDFVAELCAWLHCHPPWTGATATG